MLDERIMAYVICKERGHTSSGTCLLTLPEKHICKYCGTHYYFEQKIVESNVPEPRESTEVKRLD